MEQGLCSFTGTPNLALPTAKAHLILGSVQTADLVINHAEISRQHAQFFIHGERVDIEDLNSRNGIVLNGRRTTRSELHDTDTLGIGPVKIHVHFYRAMGPFTREFLTLAPSSAQQG
jgi:pSer/pThr/pTyr-binding forkhead associated (FHA) protein